MAPILPTTMKVGVIGAGKMAGALVHGWINKGLLVGNQVMASAPEPDAALLSPLSSLGCLTTHDNLEVGAWADMVLLAVKPGIIPIVAKQLSTLPRGELVVSVAAGVGVGRLERALGERWRVVRAMPNTAVTVGEGATVYCMGGGAERKDGDMVEQLFSTVGMCRRVSESQMDAVTGVSGSGPAYMYLALEAMADEGVRQGLERSLAYSLAAQTMVGAGRMVLDTDKHPGVLKDEVTSPSGTTIAGVRQLEKGGLRTVMMEAVAAAAERSREITEDMDK